MSEIYKALADAQKEIKAPAPDAKGQAGSRKYGYQTLASVLDAVLPPCNRQGLFITQRIAGSADDLCLITEACKDDAKAELCRYPLTYIADGQKFGSAVTYAKRYSLLGVFGIACKDDDDDGAATVGMKREPPTRNQPNTQPKPDHSVRNAAVARLKIAMNAYCANHPGTTYEKLNNGVKKRPEFANTAEFFNAVADEFEKTNAEDAKKMEPDEEKIPF